MPHEENHSVRATTHDLKDLEISRTHRRRCRADGASAATSTTSTTTATTATASTATGTAAAARTTTTTTACANGASARQLHRRNEICGGPRNVGRVTRGHGAAAACAARYSTAQRCHTHVIVRIIIAPRCQRRN